jgi:hypothetical protein
MSLKDRIYNYTQKVYEINPNQWIPKGFLEDGGKKMGYLGETTGRKCRELELEGKIQVRYNEKGHALYKYVPRADQEYQRIAELVGGRLHDDIIVI